MQKPATTESTSYSAQDLEATQCYSPMDLSPYEDTTSNNDVPLSGHKTTDQANLRHGYTFVVNRESQVHERRVGGCLTDSNASISADLTGQESDDAQFHFICSDGSSIEEKFAFTASFPAQQPILSLRR